MNTHDGNGDPIIAVDAAEAGKRIGLSESSVRRLVRNGHLPRVPHTSRFLVPVDALQRFVDGQAAA